MPKFRKKPVVIEAWELTRESIDDILAWSTKERPIVIITEFDGEDYLSAEISTLEGVMSARPGDYVIRGIQGEVYPCKADIFHATYEPAELSERTRS